MTKNKDFDYAMVATVNQQEVVVRIEKIGEVCANLVLVGKHPATNFNLYCESKDVEILKAVYNIVE